MVESPANRQRCGFFLPDTTNFLTGTDNGAQRLDPSRIPANTLAATAMKNCLSVQTPGSRLAVSLSPFREFGARYTPTSANFESRQFFAVDHSQYGVGRQIQQFSGLAWTQE
jgi:hypothetical protein